MSTTAASGAWRVAQDVDRWIDKVNHKKINLFAKDNPFVAARMQRRMRDLVSGANDWQRSLYRVKPCDEDPVLPAHA